MGFFKNIINTASKAAKELSEADNRGELSEYLSSKVSEVYDYMNKEEKEAKEFDNLIEKYCSRYEKLEYSKALSILERLKNNYENLSLYFYYSEKADCLMAIGNEQMTAEYGDPDYDEQEQIMLDYHKKANIALDCAIKYSDSSNEVCHILYLRSQIIPTNQDCGGARKFLIGALATENEDWKKIYLDEYHLRSDRMRYLFERYSDESIWNNPDFSEEDRKDIKEIIVSGKFTNIGYANRQLIFVGRDDNHIAGCYDPTDNINWVFTLDYVPSDIKFPVGHPQANTLYVAHPVNNEIYIPYEESEYNFFLDKIHELCHLLQCLGATEITFKSLKGRDTSYESDGSWSIGGEVAAKKIGTTVNGQAKKSSGFNSSNSHISEIGLVITANPTTKPYCPEDLHWMKTETQWQNLVKQRLNGNLLTYEQRISTKSVTNLSSSQKQEIKGAFENFMYNVSANYENKNDSTFKETEETEWQITAIFKPLEEFVDSSLPQQEIQKDAPEYAISTLTDDEQSYAEEVKFCLEDGTIGDKERRFLERMRTKLGISSERATEIEESLQKPQLTEDEQDYLDAVKDEIMDGMIPESSKRLLNRLRKSLNISEERAKEIEKYATGI